jgi:hypothetical protein
MKFTVTEAMAILSKQMGHDVEIVPDYGEDEWVVNTQACPGHPATLGSLDKIQVILSDWTLDTDTADCWFHAWDTTEAYCIVKYRKVN